VALVALSALPVASEVVAPAIVAGQVRQIQVDVEHAVRVDGFSLRAGHARVVLVDGVLVPSTPVAGRPVEFVFIGQGRVELEPPDEIEAEQLELFTGSRSLVESFERAVFVVALDAASDALVTRPSSEDADRIAEAAELLGSWQSSPERKLLDVDAMVFADGVGDRLAAGFFCGYFEGSRLGRFLYVVDPLAHEQVTLGQFIRPELSRREEKKTRRSIEEAQRKGKLIGVEVADLGTWDTWVSASLLSSDGNPAPGARGVEPNHYDLDVTLRGKALEMEATARVSMRVVVDGLKAMLFEMSSDLEPTGVVDGHDRELDWFRSSNELVVVLAEPAGVGDVISVEIAFTGRPIEKVTSGAFIQRNSIDWYPHTGTIDRATYTATLRWPEKFDLVAPGTSEDLGRQDGLKRRRWRLDEPSLGYSFEIGRYETATADAGEVSISVAVDRLGQQVDDGFAEDILATVVDVMDYYGEVYGPYPLDSLQVVSSPRSYSQGLRGFVTLSTAAVVDWEVWGDLLGVEDRRTVIAHEVAHQWWGNMVGWRSYRDQWISEAMADFSALLWANNRLDSGAGVDRRRGPIADWQSELLRTTDDGRPIESLGPLVVGARLDSSLSGSAYPAIVYKKGAVVLSMLSQYFREEAFLAILEEIVRVGSNRVISTDDFLGGIAQLSGTDLSWFRHQYVLGTGLPEIYYTYDLEETDDGWAVVGEATQQTPYLHRYEVVTTASGSLDVRRRAEARLDVSDSVLVVPFQVGLTGEPAMADGRRSMLKGRIMVTGESSPFRLETEKTPAVFWLDRDTEVFGRFFNTDRWPRRTAYYRGLDLEAAGDADGARAAFEQALEAEVALIPTAWESYFRPVDIEEEGEGLDARIRLALTRLHLDAGRLNLAETEFELAGELVKRQDRWRLADDLLILESRLDLLSGDARSAFRRLKKGVLGKRSIETPETWALFAIAADATGNTEELDLALERATDLGVDLGPLSP
jgi:hypothetical protein